MIDKFEFFNNDNNYFQNLLHFSMKEELIMSVGYDIFVDKMEKLIKNKL